MPRASRRKSTRAKKKRKIKLVYSCESPESSSRSEFHRPCTPISSTLTFDLQVVYGRTSSCPAFEWPLARPFPPSLSQCHRLYVYGVFYKFVPFTIFIIFFEVGSRLDRRLSSRTDVYFIPRWKHVPYSPTGYWNVPPTLKFKKKTYQEKYRNKKVFWVVNSKVQLDFQSDFDMGPKFDFFPFWEASSYLLSKLIHGIWIEI